MGPEAWKRKIGDDAWNHILGSTDPDSGTLYSDMQKTAAARTLTRACEVGFRPAGLTPKVDPAGTKVLWPASDDQQVPTLTALGLLVNWQIRGHGFLLLRAEQLMHAVAGPLLPRFQEILQAYEEQCTTEGVAPVAIDWRGFVGGTEDTAAWVSGDAKFLRTLEVLCPKPDPSAKKTVTFDGPGAQDTAG